MIDNEKINRDVEKEVVPAGEPAEEMHLDDARRVKVLSPGMLVFKRFIRNRLAVDDTVEVLSPGRPVWKEAIRSMVDLATGPVTVAHAGMKIEIDLSLFKVISSFRKTKIIEYIIFKITNTFTNSFDDQASTIK